MTDLILASGSLSRRTLLENAGVAFQAMPARIDETAVIESMEADGAPAGDIAQSLADLKALRVSPAHPEALVLGADQILVCEGTVHEKPPSLEAARDKLKALRGKTHQLVTAQAIAKNGAIIWRHLDTADLTMRTFSDDWLEAYLARGGADLLTSVGAYRLEEDGIQLFSAIKGDYFTILGLSLLPLLDFIRGHGVIGR